MKKMTTALTALTVTAALGGTYAATAGSASATAGAGHRDRHHATKSVDVEILAPGRGDNAGIAGAGWFVDLDIDFHDTTLAGTGFTANQLTGPAAHNNTAPFPGTFSTGTDDRMPGLVVLTSTTNSTLPGFSGPGTNLANLFNLTGVTDRSKDDVELWDTWIVGAPIAGKDVTTTLTVAVIDDLNHDGIYNDAPGVVPDQNADGRIDRRDLEAIGVASKIETVDFRINGAS
ncbi:hypothetical protein [Nocardioides nanhaiensis]|uniref:EF-hand domain-containing protein n=1 Tax=Nocardioides nanhaiensis TaxID=1476871 RepID=A0ABP8WHE4_9ACTN